MAESVHRHLTLTLLVVMAAAAAIVFAALSLTADAYLEEGEQRLNRDLAYDLLGEESLFADGSIDPDGLDRLFHVLMVVNPRIELYLLDEAGRILAFKADPGVVQLDAVDLEPVRRFLRGAPGPLRGDDPRHPGAREVFSVARIPRTATADESTVGYLYVVLAGEQHRSLVERFTASLALRAGAWTLALVVVMALVIALLLFRRVTRRLERLDRRIASFAPGSAGAPLQATVVEGDEIDRLESSFETMASQIEGQLRALEESAQARRELVANVSHDLRTPLTSLQGYLETLALKQGALSDDERASYLQTALDQCERLARRVAELFELSKLEAPGFDLDREPVSLAELAQDVVLELQLEAERRGVELRSELDPSTPRTPIDVERMERVLDNLIDNALRHTGAGGVVEVAVSANDGDGVRVVVTDQGCGISADDLPKVFERYYRGNGEPDSGSGLGLAIARRVVELHGSHLEVESEVGSGSRFWFDLPPGASSG